MRSLLLCTTLGDPDLALFLLQEVRSLVDVECRLYEDRSEALLAALAERPYDAVYLRDPYTSDSLWPDDATALCGLLARSVPESTYVVDGLRGADDALCEDKWRQYRRYADVMPRTEPYDPEREYPPESIYKERISSRSRGAYFDPADLVPPLDRYVVQERLSIAREYRVYSIFGEIYPLVSERSPKTESSPTSVTSVRSMPEELVAFIATLPPIGHDFHGLDIALAEDGRWYLIEVNRSPWFGVFRALSGINLAREFAVRLLRRLG